MAYGHDPEQYFLNWLRGQKDLIRIAMAEGFTKDQAIEILKVYALTGIEDNIGN